MRRTSDAAPHGLLIALAVAGCLVLVACSNGSPTAPPVSQTATDSGQGSIQTIEASTQLHLDGVAIGVGNIWAEESAPEDLTAALFITVEGDASRNRTVRVGVGEDVEVPGYRLRVVSVEATSIQIEITEIPV